MLPEPWSLIGEAFELPDGTIIAVPLPGMTLHRLVHDPPIEEDFEHRRPKLAEKLGNSELQRTGLSHFVTLEQAAEIRWKDTQRIARVEIPANPRIHVARTEQEVPGHHDVWVPPDLIEGLLETAEIVG